MPQNNNFQPLHFAIYLEVKVDQGSTKQTLPNEYLTATKIAEYLQKKTGENWTHQRVNKMLENMKYQQKPYGHWQPTIKGQKYADFSSRVPKWSPEVINLILQQQPQQLKLAV